MAIGAIGKPVGALADYPLVETYNTIISKIIIIIGASKICTNVYKYFIRVLYRCIFVV